MGENRGLFCRLIRKLRLVRFLILYRKKIKKTHTVKFEGMKLRILPGVFHPKYFFTTKLMLRNIKIEKGIKVLDMGCGSGALGIHLALRGADVTAADINPAAVKAARLNGELNKIRIKVVESDLFAKIEDNDFDVIVFNPPFFEDMPVTDDERAFYAGPGLKVLERFAETAAGHLSNDGMIYITFTDIADLDLFHRIFRDTNWSLTTIVENNILCEKIFIFKGRNVKKSRAGAPKTYSRAASK